MEIGGEDGGLMRKRKKFIFTEVSRFGGECKKRRFDGYI